jgi:hypothetical protein
MIIHNLTSVQWSQLAINWSPMAVSRYKTSTEMSAYILNTYNGILAYEIGFGTITFQNEKDYIWFLLQI